MRLVVVFLLCVTVAVAGSGVAALGYVHTSVCIEPWNPAIGVRDADVSLQVVPYGTKCAYEGGATVVHAPSPAVFAAWMVFVAALVAVCFRRRRSAVARGVL